MKDAAQGKLVDMHSDTGAIDYYNRVLFTTARVDTKRRLFSSRKR